MNNIISEANLVFFKTEEYRYNDNHTVNNENCPRPHFCMGLVLEGEAEFTDCTTNDKILVEKGDIIFVPMGSRYISKWHKKPEISYISMHFIFDYPAVFSRQKNFMLQKIKMHDFEEINDCFKFILDNAEGDEGSRLLALSKFYGILGRVLPSLKTRKEKDTDARINISIDYIEKNYTDNISIESLASKSNMSISRFFPAFKKVTGITPIEYINNYRVSRAVIMLMNDKKMSVEQISEAVGFESSAYFRRVFKKNTGKTPREYRKQFLEI